MSYYILFSIYLILTFYFLNRSHLLSFIILLELCILLISITIIYTSLYHTIVEVLILFYVLSVSSAAVGLGVLVSSCRSSKDDLLKNNDIIW